MKKQVVLSGISEDFNPKHIFECGQCFRFKKEEDESYTIVAKNRVLNVLKKGDEIHFNNTTDEEFSDIWEDFFDLKTDYGAIKKTLSKKDDYMKNAVSFGNGIRILKQDLWETVVSFIISANNNIPRIQGIIERLCERFGEPVEYNGKTYFSFPSAEKVRGDLSFLRAGYRDSYIKDACKKVLSGELSLSNIKNLSTEEARKNLLKVCGIGPKVCDCILLFGLSKCEVFPVDVWVRRSVAALYRTNDEPREFAKNKFGDLAGYAQQYLFYYMRENNISNRRD